MLSLDPWCYYPLTVQMLSTSYTPLRAKCIAPPPHVVVTTAPIEVLPSFTCSLPRSLVRAFIHSIIHSFIAFLEGQLSRILRASL